MRVPQLLVCFIPCLVFSLSVSAQQSGPTQIVQDAHALSLLSQALAVGGGAQAVAAISDYTATGNITYYADEAAQGTVTAMGTNSQEFRLDATLPSGVRSWAVHDGTPTGARPATPISTRTNTITRKKWISWAKRTRRM